jgi:hypothetical protein
LPAADADVRHHGWSGRRRTTDKRCSGQANARRDGEKTGEAHTRPTAGRQAAATRGVFAHCVEAPRKNSPHGFCPFSRHPRAKWPLFGPLFGRCADPTPSARCCKGPPLPKGHSRRSPTNSLAAFSRTGESATVARALPQPARGALVRCVDETAQVRALTGRGRTPALVGRAGGTQPRLRPQLHRLPLRPRSPCAS